MATRAAAISPPHAVTSRSRAPTANGSKRESFRRRAAAFTFYLSTALVIWGGWSIRDQRLLSPEFGTGYWLGIVGAATMASLFLYPLRKRWRRIRTWGKVSTWFRVHMTLGVIGPVLILYHSNFELGSFNSQIALFSTLVVATSGLFGRYLYSRVHYGLAGRHATLESLRSDFSNLGDSGSTLARLLPAVIADLEPVEQRLMTPRIGVLESFVAALQASVLTRWAALKARWHLRGAVAEACRTSPLLERERRRLKRNATRYIANRMRALRKFSQFAWFERLMSLWHVVHYPLFIVLVLSAVVHVIAVHLY